MPQWVLKFTAAWHCKEVLAHCLALVQHHNGTVLQGTACPFFAPGVADGEGAVESHKQHR